MIWFTLLEALAVGAKKYTLKGENVKKKSIRIGKTVIKIIIWGGEWSVLQLKIPLQHRRKMKSVTMKPMIYLPK